MSGLDAHNVCAPLLHGSTEENGKQLRSKVTPAKQSAITQRYTVDSRCRMRHVYTDESRSKLAQLWHDRVKIRCDELQVLLLLLGHYLAFCGPHGHSSFLRLPDSISCKAALPDYVLLNGCCRPVVPHRTKLPTTTEFFDELFEGLLLPVEQLILFFNR